MDTAIQITNNSENCAICLESLHIDSKHLECSHGFHVECIIAWMNKHIDEYDCPLCRKSYRTENVITKDNGVIVNVNSQDSTQVHPVTVNERFRHVWKLILKSISLVLLGMLAIVGIIAMLRGTGVLK